jgi:hypothetical protein
MLSRAPESVQTLEKHVKMAKRESRLTFRGDAEGSEAYHHHCAVVLVAKNGNMRKSWTSFASAPSVGTDVENCLIQDTISSRGPQLLGQVLDEL